MESFEPKKLALIRIWQILKEYSDYDHPLTQDDIARHLESDYGIVIERKAISRNISLLKEAGAEIESGRTGSYLERRDFEDSELKLLIDGVLCSKYITAKQSKDLIDRLCGLSNKYFRSHVKNIHSVNDWYKTDNQALFYNIELIDTASYGKLRNSEASKKPYLFSVMQTKTQWSQNTYMPYLKIVDDYHLSHYDMGQKLLYDDRYIVCENASYKVKRIEDNSIIDTVEISQDKNGIDKEDRVQKLKNYLSSKTIPKTIP